MTIGTIYADPELAAEYTAGAWAAATHARHIAVRLAICIALLLGPGVAGAYAFSCNMALRARQAVVVANQETIEATDRAIVVEKRLEELEAQSAVNSAMLGTSTP